MIANLLPGIRELRAPLAAGYLWLLCVWLIVEPRLPAEGEKRDAVTESLTQLADAATPVAVAAAVTFAAYLVGALSGAITEFGFRVLEIAVAGEVPTFARLTRVTVGPVSVELEPASSASSDEAREEVDVAVRERIRELRNLQSSIAERLGAIDAQRRRLGDERRDAQLAAESEALNAEMARIRRDIDESLAAGQEAHEVLEDLPIPRRLHRRFRLSSRGHRAIESLVREQRNECVPQLTSRGISMRDALGKESATHIESEGSVTNGIFLQVLDELDLAATRLIGDQPELFSAVDRPRAESEFRLWLALPLLALVVTMVALTDSALWLIALALPISLFGLGLTRRRASGDLIADALYLGRVEAPVLERLRRAADLPPRVEPRTAPPPIAPAPAV